MTKYAVLMLSVLIFSNLSFANPGEDEGEDADGGGVSRGITFTASSDQAVAIVASADQAVAVSSDTTDDQGYRETTPIEKCLLAVFNGGPGAAPENEEDIVVTAFNFGSNFWATSNLVRNGDIPPGKSFFITKNGRFGPKTSFEIMDTTQYSGERYHCGSTQRLRRLAGGEGDSDDNAGEDFDAQDDDQAADAGRVSGDISMADQWGRGLGEGSQDTKKAIYYVKTDEKNFRVSCTVGKRGFLGIGARKNEHCRGDAVASVVASEVRTCEKSEEGKVDFIEKSIRQRIKFFKKNKAKNVDTLSRKRQGYIAIEESCSPLIGLSSDAKDAVRDLAKELNNQVEDFNRSQPNSGISKVTLPAK